MELLLCALGLGTCGEASNPTLQSTLALPATNLVVRISSAREEDLLPDLAGIAAATETGILALEEEAQSLSAALFPSALSLIRRWVKDLHCCTQANDPMVSFRLQFLRSNVLEKAFWNLRQNSHVRAAMIAACRLGSEQLFLADLKSILEICLPRAATSLAAPILKVVFGNDPPEQVMMILTALRMIREDWREVVWRQSVKRLEQRLDLLTYDLQNVQVAPGQDMYRLHQVLYDRIWVLVVLCGAIAQSRDCIEARSVEVSEALQELRLELAVNAFLSSGCTTCCNDDCMEKPKPQTQAMDTSAPPTKGNATHSLDLEIEIALHSDIVDGWVHDLPDVEYCEAAVEAIVSKTTVGVRKGLVLLGLPDCPLCFVPGSELKLCGHDIRMEVNAMMCHWLEGRIWEFYQTLQAIRSIVGQRQAQPDEHVTAPGIVKKIGLCVPYACSSTTAHQQVLSSPSWSSSEFAALVVSVEEKSARETELVAGRLATEMQQCRAQLIVAVTSHLEAKQDFVSSSIVLPKSGRKVDQQLQKALRDVRELCGRVEVALGNQAPNVREPMSSGMRCRAKWMDGIFYDATIEKVLRDGTVVVKWLRPRPLCTNSTLDQQPLITISGMGGDDTLHRLVHQTDVRLDGAGGCSWSDAREALAFFRSRSPEDHLCAECGQAGTEWASSSFGVYLCSKCAIEHQQLGARLSLVRPMDDGWGWTSQELQYMRAGGNAFFCENLERYPTLKPLSIRERCSSRFGEYYRRFLDAACMGAPSPKPPPLELVAQPGPGQFVSATEAVAIIRAAALRFEETAHAAAAHHRLCL